MRFRSLILLLMLFLFQNTAPAGPGEQGASEKEFCRLDKNNDRELTFEEFQACEFLKLEHIRALPFTEPKDISADKGGSLSDEDLKAYLFKKADKDRDSKISRKEWEEFYNSLLDPGGGLPHPHHDRR